MFGIDSTFRQTSLLVQPLRFAYIIKQPTALMTLMINLITSMQIETASGGYGDSRLEIQCDYINESEGEKKARG
jgi:hypothetical protein